MKKLYTLLLMSVFALGLSYAQAPIFFSEYIEGDGGNNKALEIYNPTGDEVDLSAYQIMGNSNGSEWKYWNLFADGAVVPAEGVYVVANSGSDQEILDVADETSSATYFNGDDARALIYIAGDDTTIIDVIGVEGEDPGAGWAVAGVAEATANRTLLRKASIVTGTDDWAASAGTTVEDSQWEVLEANDFSNLGKHNEILISSISAPIDVDAGATEISTPGGTLQLGVLIDPINATNQVLDWSVDDRKLASIDENGLLTAINDGDVVVTATATDGSGVVSLPSTFTLSNQVPVNQVLDITVTGTDGATEITEAAGTLQMIATVDPADADDPTVTWSTDNDDVASIDAAGLLTAVNNGTVVVTATANDGYGAVGTLEITVSGQIKEVADLSALRAMDPSDKSTIYKVTGEVFLTFAQDSRNQKIVQDADAGITIDDSPGTITTVYNPGDGITGLTGTLSEYGSLLQLIPTADPGAASSTGNDISPIEVTIADLNTDHEPYESRLVILKSITFDDADGSATFEDGKNYDMTCAAGSMALRTNYKGTTLLGTIIPDSANVTGIIGEYNGTPQLFPRSADDVEELIAYIPSDDASITDLMVDGVSVPGFSPAMLTYNMELAQGTTEAPAVTVATANDSAKVEVTDATDLFGTEAERTTTVVITSEDMSASKTYTIIFTVDNTGISNANAVSMEVYPVPANDFLQIRSSEALRQLSVVSITGSTVEVRELAGEKSIQMDISSLESGVYFLKLSGDTGSKILRFVKN